MAEDLRQRFKRSRRSYLTQNLLSGSGEISQLDLDLNLDVEELEILSTDEFDDDLDVEENTATAGIIEKIILRNFMCHDNFELNLGPRINIIIGSNGSGKSAILTGLLVGLGAKASLTSRASAINNLIKYGRNTAQITIVLKNEGPAAYKHELYGDRIVVERTLRREKAATYSIKSASGRVITDKKKDLDLILTKFHITVNNPLAFLSQDTAREFLTQSDGNKFKFYMKGALLEDIINNLELTASHIKNVETSVTESKEYLSKAWDLYNNAKHTYELYDRQRDLRRRMENIKAKIYWFNVFSIEKRLATYQDNHDEKMTTINQLEKEKNIIDEQIPEQELKKEKLLEESKLIQHNLEIAERQLREIVAARSKKRSAALQKRDEYHEAEAKIQEERLRIEKLEKEIDDEMARLDQANNQGKHHLKDEIDRIKEHLKSNETERGHQSSQLELLEGKINDSEYDEQKREISRRIELMERELENVSTATSNKYGPWGKSMTEIIRDISANASHFHQTPVGPLGVHISIRSQFATWKKMLNSILQKTLASFVVVDEHDRNVLAQILQKYTEVQNRPNVIVRKFEVFDFSNGQVDIGDSILDALNFDNEVAKYTLIDTNSIELTLLACSDNQLREFASIPGVFASLKLHDDNSGVRATKKGASYNNDPVFYKRGPAMFSGGVSAADINEIRQSLLQQRQKLDSLKGDERVIMNQIRAIRKKQAQLGDEEGKLKRRRTQLEQEMRKEGDTALIERNKVEIENRETNITNYMRILDSLKDEIIEDRETLRETKHKEKEQQVKTQSVKNLFSSLEKKVLECEALQDEYRNSKAQLDAQIVREQETLEIIDKKKEDMELTMLPHLEKAQELCSRDDIHIDWEHDTKDSITQEYKEAQAQIEEMERGIGRSLEDVQLEFTQARTKLDDATEQNREVMRSYELFKNQMEMRKEFLYLTIRNNNSSMNQAFEQSLSYRGMHGRLHMNLDSQSLVLHVQTRNEQDKRTVDSLSGGEKSFVQIAFLLSLWHIMESRVRALDEFDVFMDSVNRTVGIKMLVQELQNLPKSQTIFITPQDTTNMDLDWHALGVKIHRLQPPRL